MIVRASSLASASPLGRGFAQLHALHGAATGGERADRRAPFRHNQFLRVLVATLGSSSPKGIVHTAQPATVRSHGSGSSERGPEGTRETPANAMEAGTYSAGGGHG